MGAGEIKMSLYTHSGQERGGITPYPYISDNFFLVTLAL